MPHADNTAEQIGQLAQKEHNLKVTLSQWVTNLYLPLSTPNTPMPSDLDQNQFSRSARKLKGWGKYWAYSKQIPQKLSAGLQIRSVQIALLATLGLSTLGTLIYIFHKPLSLFASTTLPQWVITHPALCYVLLTMALIATSAAALLHYSQDRTLLSPNVNALTPEQGRASNRTTKQKSPPPRTRTRTSTAEEALDIYTAQYR